MGMLLKENGGGVEEAQLCFNRAEFNRPDFNVERFVGLSRRRANLEQIHSHLCLYLRIVQNSMIELINDDYADFVNLSSNLVSLRSSIDKISLDLETTWDEFCKSTDDLLSSVGAVEERWCQLTESRRRQLRLRDEIQAMEICQQLFDLLPLPDALTVAYIDRVSSAVAQLETSWRRLETSREGEELSAARSACLLELERSLRVAVVADMGENGRCRLLPFILPLLRLCNGIDGAVADVLTMVISPFIPVKVEENGGDLTVILKDVIDRLFELRTKWSDFLKEEGNGRDFPALAFVDQCLLSHLLTVLDQQVMAMLDRWPVSSSSRSLLRLVRDNFSLPVYFKLATQPLQLRINEAMENVPFMETSSIDTDGLVCSYTKAVHSAVKEMWNEDVYLSPLADKFWDLSLKLYVQYLHWIEKQLMVDNKEQKWQSLVLIASDVRLLDEKIFEFSRERIWPCFEELELEVTAFGRCLSAFSSLLLDARKKLCIKIRELIAVGMCQELEGVTEIPRQYRWTRKAAPTESSGYVSQGLAILNDFGLFASKYAWSEEERIALTAECLDQVLTVFCKNAEQVLQSVEQTGSSLQRLKRKGAATDSTGGDSDEMKIRRQLHLDLSLFRQRAVQLGLTTEIIDRLCARALVSTVVDQEK